MDTICVSFFDITFRHAFLRSLRNLFTAYGVYLYSLRRSCAYFSYRSTGGNVQIQSKQKHNFVHSNIMVSIDSVIPYKI